MNNKKPLIGLGVFLACLWVAVVTTYGVQMKRDKDLGKGIGGIKVLDDCACDCSSSSASSSGE